MAKYALRMQWLTTVGLVCFYRWSKAPLIRGVSGKLMPDPGRSGRGDSEDISCWKIEFTGSPQNFVMRIS